MGIIAVCVADGWFLIVLKKKQKFENRLSQRGIVECLSGGILRLLDGSKDTMLVLILLLVVGSGLVYISKYNFLPVSVNLGVYTISNIPLFYVIVGSLVIGLVLSYLVYLVHSISTSFKFRGKDKEIKKSKDEVLELTKSVHQLELENERQKIPPILSRKI